MIGAAGQDWKRRVKNVKRFQNRGKWLLWVQWVFVTALGAAVGWLTGGLLGFGVASAAPTVGFRETWHTFILWGLVSGVTATLIIACAQIALLPNYVNVTRGMRPVLVRQWLLATAMGAGASMLFLTTVYRIQASYYLYPIAVLIGGLALGVTQWLVLRQYSPRARWWIPTSLVAWLGGWYVSMYLARLMFGEIYGGEGTLAIGIAIAYYSSLYIGLSLATVVAAGISGFVLVWLLHQPNTEVY